MDPFVNIARQRQLAAQIVSDTEALAAHRDKITDGGTIDEMAVVGAEAMGRELAIEHAALELAELVTALDEWQGTGGFSPYPLRDETIRVRLGDQIDLFEHLRDTATETEDRIVATHRAAGLCQAYHIVFEEDYHG